MDTETLQIVRELRASGYNWDKIARSLNSKRIRTERNKKWTGLNVRMRFLKLNNATNKVAKVKATTRKTTTDTNVDMRLLKTAIESNNFTVSEIKDIINRLG